MEKLIYFENLTFMISLITYFIAGILFFIYVAKLSDKIGVIGLVVTFIGFALHTIAMTLRTIEAARLPFSNQFEFAASFAWGIVLCFIVIFLIYRFISIGAFVMPLAFIVMGYASMQSRAIRPLMPALQSHWLTFHVGTAVFAYGAFAVACGISIIYLIDAKRPENRRILQSPEISDILSYRMIAFGFLMLSLVIITGAVWAQQAWSRYWAWDPKETWSLITWIIYAVYLHLRFRKNWKGKAAAWFAIIGFISVLFTFIGVNTLLPSIHSYV